MKVLIVRPSPNKMNVNTYNLQEIGLAKALVRKGCVCDVMYYCGNDIVNIGLHFILKNVRPYAAPCSEA